MKTLKELINIARDAVRILRFADVEQFERERADIREVGEALQAQIDDYDETESGKG